MKYSFKKANILTSVILIITFSIILVMRSGRFAKDPTITHFPKNCYSETLYVITDKDYSPYSFYDSKGNFSGHDVELIYLIANELQMNIDLQFMEWSKGIEAMHEGKANVLMTCDYSDSFAGVDTLLKTEAVSKDDFLVYSKKKVTSIDSLYGKRIAIMKNGNVLSEIDKMGLGKYCKEYSDNRQAMLALVNDEVDFAIMRQTVGTVLLRELKTFGIKGYISLGESDMCFGINTDNPELVEKINNAIEKLKINGTTSRLRTKWLTTFIRPYSLFEILSNNLLIVFIFISLIGISVSAAIKSEFQKKRIEEEHIRNSHVMEWLTQDFICVNYVELTDEPTKDLVVNYRISQRLKELIPGWEEEKRFSKKLDLLCENLVYEQDKEQFYEDVRRKKVLKELQKAGVYFVNTRVFIDNEINYFQMKFLAVRQGKKIKAIVAGLHSVDAQTKKEMALQKQLQEALESAEVASKAKTEFLFNMSHDIRTPLNAITGFTSMAIKHIDNKEKALDCLKKTQQSSDLLLAMINGVLDVSRIESGKGVLEKQSGDVFYSFANIESTMQELAVSRNVNLSFEFGNIKDRYVFVDMNRCTRVFVNIISNAIKYSNKGGFVRVRCDQLKEAPKGYGVYRYVFEDNGIGMSEEFQKHVFEKFSRENNANHNDVQGTGLGMAVCKSFVELMNGTIECYSELGKGTIFTVILPLELQTEEKYTDVETGLVVSVGEEKTIKRKDFKGKKVLVADDSEMNLEIAVDILQDEGFIVETVLDGEQVLDKIKEKGPDYYSYILMDIRMPKMGGYEASREIRKLYPDKKLPIIALSANAFDEDKKASLEAGMDGHVAKPININELIKTLARL